MAGILTLLGQYDAALSFPISYSWEQLVSTPLSRCSLAPISGGDYVAQHPMPADYVQRIRVVMQDLARDAEADPVVRTMAACIARHIS